MMMVLMALFVALGFLIEDMEKEANALNDFGSLFFRDLRCNVPTFGHHYIIECYDDQSGQMEVIASTWAIKGYFGVRLASLILFHHYDPFRIAWLWFHCIPTISMILSYFGL
jgi:hypothetical protein